MKKILILGSNSFSGSSFANFLLKKKIKVYGVSRSKEPANFLISYANNKFRKENFKFFQLDINKDSTKIIELIKRYKIEYIINFVAQGMVAESWKKPLDWYETNVISQVKFLDKIIAYGKIKKYVNFTTPEVYGSTDKLIKESFNFAPSTPYAISRAAFDFHLKAYSNAYNFPVIFTRAANVYGPNQQLYRVIPKAISFFKMHKKFQLDGGGVSKRSFIYIEDVCEALFKIIKNGSINNTYHISTDELISVKSLILSIAKLINIDPKQYIQNNIDRLGKDHTYSLDNKKLKKELNWSPRIKLKDGILKTVKWIDNNFDEIKNSSFEYKHKK
jgi:dTDP-glucose 4,6-dehydratase